MQLTERFLNYTQFDTQSAEDSESVPNTAKQLVFAEYLKKELENEGFSDVEMDENGYIYATLKANTKVTFYAQHGDYLSRIAVYLTFVLLITWIAMSIIRWNQAGERPAKRKKK